MSEPMFNAYVVYEAVVGGHRLEARAALPVESRKVPVPMMEVAFRRTREMVDREVWTMAMKELGWRAPEPEEAL